ncbi:decaprenyl-phosphate phosphoribosyltransferase [Vulgatibacter sp.]|uniref:decaprenyl-phosphate phosphoribosyltransferase n=1 Tax=Vulgatibacter sp. TaxID=1971226 RepID=UPI00356B36B2
MAIPNQVREQAAEQPPEILAEVAPLPADAGVGRAPTGYMLRTLVQGMRPHQWVKNGFLFAPLVFSRNLFHLEAFLTAVAAFFLFSAAASAVYLGNDVLDVEADRKHPVKRFRPIASGALPIPLAAGMAAFLAGGSVAVATAIDLAFAAVILGYLVMNTAYSVSLKRIAYVDVGVIATGFVLRVLAGALAIAVPTSNWLFVCTFALALFLGLGKRKHELLVAVESGHDGTKARKSLKGYQLRHVNVALLLAGVLAAASYVLYTVAPETHEKFDTYLLALTLPFPAFGIWRFNQLVSHSARASSPTEALITDPPFVANMVIWGVAVVAILYSALSGMPTPV